MPPSNTMPPRYLRTPEAARFLGLSPRTMEKHRLHGTGPLYRKLGGRVVYEIGDLQQWANKGTRRSTTKPIAEAHMARAERTKPFGG